MSATKIGKAIKENCKDDKVMQNMLIELLDFNLTGRSWYKEEYARIIEKYAASEGENNGN